MGNQMSMVDKQGGAECMAAGLGGGVRGGESLSTPDELDDGFNGSEVRFPYPNISVARPTSK